MDALALEQPKLRPAVSLHVSGRFAHLTGSSGTHKLSFPAFGRRAFEAFLDDLRAGGLTPAEFAARHPDIENLPALLQQLDDLRLLTESEFAPVDGFISGSQLDRNVRRMVRRLQSRIAEPCFYARLTDGSATPRQLIGYALEYFWLVRAAPALIAPALATASDLRLRKELQSFLLAEVNHDRFLVQALTAAGVDADLTLLQPLPTTFQLCASLGAYAQQHLLSFLAALFLFEQPRPHFLDAFEQRALELALPKQFYEPLRRHSEINEHGEHGAISTGLLALVPAVSPEEQVVVLRNVAVMVETAVRQEQEILDYYGDATRPSPRLFD